MRKSPDPVWPRGRRGGARRRLDRLAGDNWVGTWKLNIAKSKFGPGPRAAEPDDHVRDRGRRRHQARRRQRRRPTARPCTPSTPRSSTARTVPWTGNPNADTAAPKRIDANSYENIWKKDGKVMIASRVDGVRRREDPHHHPDGQGRQGPGHGHDRGVRETVAPCSCFAGIRPAGGGWPRDGLCLASATAGAITQDSSRSAPGSAVVDLTRTLDGRTSRHRHPGGPRRDGGELMVVVIDTVSGAVPRTFTDRALQPLGPRRRQRNRGVMLLAAIKDRKAEIVVATASPDSRDRRDGPHHAGRGGGELQGRPAAGGHG